MRPWWGVGPVCALVLLTADVGSAHAAWDNVFQATCFGCRKQTATANYYAAPVTANYADPCCAPPQPVCTTRYVQRCYYQPVTTYQTKSYYEAVTTYRTSYYYEPVTSYRYSCYVDPCTGCSHQVACPQTCYKLRSQCCPVQSWVQRCCQVPVQSYRIASYWEPVTTCCQPTTPCCPTPTPQVSAACPNGNCGQPGVSVTPGQPGVSVTPTPGQPGVSEQRLTPQPGVNVIPNSDSPLYRRDYGPTTQPPLAPTTPNSINRQTGQTPPRTLPPVPPPPPPAVRLDRIVSLPQSSVQGQIVRGDGDAPRANAKLVFVTASGARQQATADANGKFQVTLASGSWLVYVDGEGQSAFHSRINLADNEIRQVVLVAK
jgi:hypothetical protein